MSPSLAQRLGHSPTLHLLQEGSFSHEAALLLQQQIPDLVLEFHQRIIDVWSRLAQGHSVLLPVENAGSGPVKAHLELLRGTLNRQVIGEVRYCVDMRAGGKPGTDPRTVESVHSHRQALLQCDQWLRSLPALRDAVPEDSTAHAMRRVACQNGDCSRIALGTRTAIQQHGLVDLYGAGASVANLPPPQNVTQFLVVSPNGEHHDVQPERRHHALLLEPERDVRGVLATILSIIKDMRVNLQSFHSLHPYDGRRAFYMETDGAISTPDEVRCMAESLRKSRAVASLDWVGSWDDIVLSPEYAGLSSEDAEAESRVLGEERLDCDLPYHSFRFRTRDLPGVLYDVIQPLASMHVNLLDLDSATRGEKQYDFIATVDASRCGKSRFKTVADMLRSHPSLLELEWMHSEELPPVLGPYAVTDSAFVLQAAGEFMQQHVLRAGDAPLPAWLVSALQLPESGQNAIGIEEALLADPDLYRRRDLLADMIRASSKRAF